MSQQVIQTDKAPKAIGPYSQAIVANGFVFTAGQIPIDPATGNLIEGGIEDQTRRVITNLKAILEAAGTSLDNVVKTTVFLHAMSDFQAMNTIYTQFFTAAPPARSTVGNLDLPRGVLVEIEVVAALPNHA